MKRLLLAATAACLLAGPANAAQIVLSGASIVGATPSLSNNPWGAHNIFDNQTGAIAPESAGDGSFWLANDLNTVAYITIDLGAAYSDLSFDLFNTHNAHHFDRGVGNFQIFAANELLADGANGFTLGGATRRLINGRMVAETDNTIEAQSFAAGPGAAYRYIQFRPTSVAATAPYSPSAYGLNEMRVFGELGATGAVPEPASWALMITGFGLAGATLRRRTRLLA
jgi:hypothetical protein